MKPLPLWVGCVGFGLFLVLLIFFLVLNHTQKTQTPITLKELENSQFDPNMYLKEKITNEHFSEKDLKILSNEVVGYVLGKSEYDTQFFSEKENYHLHDVKTIFIVMQGMLAVSLIILLVFTYHHEPKTILTAIWYGSLGAGAFFLTMLGAIIIFFEPVFYSMHLALFRNDYWLLDPKTDLLINLFPEQYFKKLGIEVVQWIVAGCSLAAIASKLFLKGYKNIENSKKYQQ